MLVSSQYDGEVGKVVKVEIFYGCFIVDSKVDIHELLKGHSTERVLSVRTCVTRFLTQDLANFVKFAGEGTPQVWMPLRSFSLSGKTTLWEDNPIRPVVH